MNEYPALKNILTMMSSSSVSQIIPFITAPILTRMYLPEDFGVYEIYYSLMTVFVVIPNLRLENAMLIEKTVNRCFNILMFVFLSNLAFLVIGLLLAFFLNDFIGSYYNIDEAGNWIYMIPIGMFLSSVYNLLTILLIRFSKFKFLAFNKIFLTVSNAVIQISFGVLMLGASGLIYGNIISYLLAVLLIAIPSIKLLKSNEFQIKKQTIIKTLRENKDFVIYTLPGDFISNFSNQLPTILIGKYFSSQSLGFYGMARRIIGLPLAFISGAIQDVFKKEATDEFNSKGNIKKTYTLTFGLLVIFGLILVSGLYLFGEVVIVGFLGEKWKPSVEIIQVLSVLFSIKFISGTLNYVFLIKSKQKLDLVFQIIQLVVVVAAFKLASMIKYDFYETLILYTLLISIYSIINLNFSYKYAK